ncbi:MAG: c-type cytochrome [Desulfuromonadales bacterium]
MTMLEQPKEKHPQAAHDFDSPIELRSNPVPRYFAFLFYGLILWAVLFLAYYLFSGWSSQEEFRQDLDAHRQQVQAQQAAGGSAGVAAVAADPEKLRASAAKLYAENCLACHGAAGEGGIGPALAAAEYSYGNDPASVQSSIADGRPGGMPAFGNQFSAEQVAALASYIRSLNPAR